MVEMLYKNREDMVYEVLKKEILDLILKPGQLISENEICERFEVSRTPVRNALRLLEDQKYIVVVPYRGIYITLLNLSNIKQMIYMRLAVELKILEDFMEMKDNSNAIDDIKYMIRKQEAIIKESGFVPEQFYRLDAKMHEIWFLATKKEKLWEMIQAHRLHYTRFRMLDFGTETDFNRIIKEHKNILSLVEKGNFSELKDVLKEHLYFSMKRMRYQIDVEYKNYFEEEPEEGKFDI
ncbi:GntR family transcriptional regulator [Fusobacterium sp. PH5-44]|uniref:GntR family transcriptional regulator n=1 Tax=unclassified Fusobacterium TaxID=2648384 RepID=UPI003D238C29